MLGLISLIVFILLLVASFRRWIRQDVLPLQSLLVLGSLLILALALLFGKTLRTAQFFTAATLHPITATIAGFLLAGAVDAAGGFAAASRVLTRMARGFLGMSGTIVLLVSLPTLFAMPCGRVWAAALIPAALMFGSELASRQNNTVLLPAIVFGLIVNAAASCGPSPLGGIGMMAEGTAGLNLNSLSDSQQIAIIVITLLAMLAVSRLPGMAVKTQTLLVKDAGKEELPDAAYFAFLIYIIGLGTVFITQPPIPIQTLLLAMTVVVMIVGHVGFRRLLAGLMIHPITAMVSGFMMAGALLIAGGFDTLSVLLTWLAEHTPLGFIGVGILLVYLPVIFPMPCGRIIAAALLPGVILFGRQVGVETGLAHSLPAMLSGFIICCAASCAPSPLGGIGGIGEGNLRQPAGASAHPLQLSILLGAPVAPLVVAFLGTASIRYNFPVGMAAMAFGVGSGLVVNLLVKERFYSPGGLVGGALVGALIAVF